MLTSDDFTTSETIDSFQAGDNTIEIVGYVGVIETNLHREGSETKYKKFLCCNGSKRVQVTAWKEKIHKLESLELGHIVHVNSLKFNKPDSKYNTGNVPFELLLDDNSEIVSYGIYDACEKELAPEDVSILEAYDKLGKKIKIEGVVKTEIGIHENKDFKSTVASITDTTHEIELKINFDPTKLKKKMIMGNSVMVTGVVDQYSPGPILLRIDSPDDVIFLESPRVSFVDVMKGFYVK